MLDTTGADVTGADVTGALVVSTTGGILGSITNVTDGAALTVGRPVWMVGVGRYIRSWSTGQ